MQATSLRTLRVVLISAFVLAACRGMPPPETTSPSATQAVEPTGTPLEVQPSPLPPTPTIVADATPERHKHPVVLISWDGAPAGLVYDLMAGGELPAFAAFASRGMRAEYALSVDPPLTVPAQSSLATGMLPAHTGMVSNSFHNPNDSFYWYRSGFEEPLNTVEPLWVTASRAGLTSAVLFFPGARLDIPKQLADLTIGYPVRDAYSRQGNVLLEVAPAWNGQPDSFSPALEGRYQIPQVSTVSFLVLDTLDDGQTNYDTACVSVDRFVEAETPCLRIGEWGRLRLLTDLGAGASFLIQEITGEGLTFYHSGVHHNSAAPHPLLAELNERFGFPPGGADSYALEHGWISENDFLYQLEEATAWTAEVAAWVYTSYQPDLFFIWQDVFDAAGHAFLMHDPRQPGYTPERAGQLAAMYRAAGAAADQALQTMLAPVDLQTATVILVADHGMAPIHTAVYPNTVLEQAGLLVLDDRDYVVVPETKAIAFASGGAAHIYINLQGREVDGIVPAEDYSGVQQKIVDLLRSLNDPLSGEPVFARVLKREELGGLGLDHPNAGDVFVQANAGYALDGWRGNATIFAPVDYYGQHGFASELPEMNAIFLAGGYHVAGDGVVIPGLRLLDVSPTIAAWLNLEPPLPYDGDPIPSLLSP